MCHNQIAALARRVEELEAAYQLAQEDEYTFLSGSVQVAFDNALAQRSDLPEECQRGNHAWGEDGGCECCGEPLPDEDDQRSEPAGGEVNDER